MNGENYVGKNSVHFQRNHSAKESLEFHRGNAQVKLPDLLPGKQLIKKIEDLKKSENRNNGVQDKSRYISIRKELLVVDYRNREEPDANEEDYKEIVNTFFKFKERFII